MIPEISLKEYAYDILKGKIINCELLPGQDILEEQIAKEIGASKTPVRQAIHQLEQEKLITIYPRKGTIVSPITVEYIYEVFNTRELIEPQIGKRICGNVAIEAMLNFKEQFEKMQFNISDCSNEECLNLDYEFHRFIVKNGKNGFLIELMDKIFAHDQRIRMMSIKSDRVKDFAKDRYQPEHLQIIDAFIERNEEKVEALLCQHIRKSRETALKLDY